MEEGLHTCHTQCCPHKAEILDCTAGCSNFLPLRLQLFRIGLHNAILVSDYLHATNDSFVQCWAATEAADGSATTEQLPQKRSSIASAQMPTMFPNAAVARWSQQSPLMVGTWRKLQMAIKVARGQNTAFGSPSTFFLAYKESSRVALKT